MTRTEPIERTWIGTVLTAAAVTVTGAGGRSAFPAVGLAQPAIKGISKRPAGAGQRGGWRIGRRTGRAGRWVSRRGRLEPLYHPSGLPAAVELPDPLSDPPTGSATFVRATRRIANSGCLARATGY